MFIRTTKNTGSSNRDLDGFRNRAVQRPSFEVQCSSWVENLMRVCLCFELFRVVGRTAIFKEAMSSKRHCLDVPQVGGEWFGEELSLLSGLVIRKNVMKGSRYQKHEGRLIRGKQMVR